MDLELGLKQEGEVVPVAGPEHGDKQLGPITACDSRAWISIMQFPPQSCLLEFPRIGAKTNTARPCPATCTRSLRRCPHFPRSALRRQTSRRLRRQSKFLPSARASSTIRLLRGQESGSAHHRSIDRCSPGAHTE